ncbi:hypothetical protein ACFL57_02325, partial [Candidatus Margulisiibacteriota bacterium]
MKKLFIGLMILGMVVITAFGVPNSIQYKGRLMNDGVLVNGVKTFDFVIYDSIDGSTELWSTDNVGINVIQGVYSVELGDANNPVSPNALAGGSAYLEITVSNQTFSPRMKINSVGYALQAGAVTGEENVFPSDGGVGIGTTTPERKLHVDSGATDSVAVFESSDQNVMIRFKDPTATVQPGIRAIGDGIGFYIDGTNPLFVSGDGNVGIGTIAPAYDLDVVGTINASQAILVGGQPMETGKWDGETDIYYTAGNVGIGTPTPSATLSVSGETSGTPAVSRDILRLYSATPGEGTGLHIGVNDADGYVWLEASEEGQSDSRDIILNYLGGKVGIGTVEPVGDLEIEGSSAHVDLLLDSTSNSYASRINFSVESGDNAHLGVYDNGYTSVPEYAGNVVLQAYGRNIDLVAFGGNDEIRFYTGGRSANERRMVIDSDGKVGIGTTAPTGLLHVSANALVVNSDGKVGIGTTAPETALHINGGGADNRLMVRRGNERFTIQVDDTLTTIRHGEGSSDAAAGHGEMLFETDAAEGVNPTFGGFTFKGPTNTFLRILNDGNVGIKDTTPDYDLDVAGTINASAAVLVGGQELQSGKWDGDTNIYYTAGNVGIGNTSPTGLLHVSANALVVKSDGKVGIGTTDPSYKMQVNVGTNANLHVRSAGADEGVRLQSAGDNASQGKAMEFRASLFEFQVGKVGIGTTDPDYALDVAGDMGINEYIYHNSDADTYIKFDSGNDDIRIVAGGVGMFRFAEDDSQDIVIGNYINNDADFRWDSEAADGAFLIQGSNGNVGIGTTAPTWSLDVEGYARINRPDQSTSGYGVLQVDSGAGSLMRVEADGNVGIGDIGPDASLEVNSVVSGNAAFQVKAKGWDGQLREAIYVNTTGNVGIGTTNLAHTLDIASTDDQGWMGIYSAEGYDGSITFVETGVSIRGKIGYDVSSDVFKITRGTFGTNDLVINNSGKVGIGTATPGSYSTSADDLVVYGTEHQGITIVSGTEREGSLHFADGTSGNAPYRGYVRYIHTDDVLYMGTSGVEQMRIDSAGKVGIGTTGPKESLDVDGAIVARSARSTNAQAQGASTVAYLDTYNDVARLGVGSDGANDKGIFVSVLDGGTVVNAIAASSNGSVGIGTTAPDYKTHIYDESTVNSGRLFLGRSKATEGTLLEYDGVNNKFNLQTVDGNVETPRLTVQLTDGRVGIGITSPARKFHVHEDDGSSDAAMVLRVATGGTGDAATTYSLQGSQEFTIGMDNSDSDKFKISSSGALGANDRLTIDTDGNVGIGKTNPGNALEVIRTGATNCRVAIGATGTGKAELYLDASNGDFVGGDYFYIQHLDNLSTAIDN